MDENSINIFTSSRWFSPTSTAQEFEELLKGDGRDGVFGVRRSTSNKADFVLSVWRNNGMTNIKIINHGDYYDPSIGESFASLSDLVAYFFQNPNELKEKNGDWIYLRHPLKFDEPTEERWFHGSLSSRDAEKQLLESDVDGSFLVRRSMSVADSYVISALVSKKVYHIMIIQKHSKYNLAGGQEFDSLEQLIAHYRQWSMVETSGVVVSLKSPLNTTWVNLNSFEHRKNALANENDDKKKDGYSEEFETLQQQEMRTTKDRNTYFKQGLRPENKAKNRFKNILPYDETRVKLSSGVESDGGDYINANFIEMANNKNTYIATQGALTNTCKDFWQMVWQYNAVVVHMVTNEVEKGRNKCYRYWPSKIGELQQHGLYCVTLDSESNDGDYYTRHLSLALASQPNQKRKIKQYHYVKWPDHGVPPDPGPCLQGIMDMNKDMDDYEARHRVRPPIIVHCSAGIGRTGTVIVLDVLIHLITKYGMCVDIDIPKTISQIRGQRSGMVQTASQYKFIYDAILHFMTYHKVKAATAANVGDSEYGNISELFSKPYKNL